MGWVDWEETVEERSARIDRILERNSGPKEVCICCRFEIDPDVHTKVDSAHGPYHGAPLKCVEGRDD